MQSPTRKRRRLARSCEQCRHRKIACDQGHPCGRCSKSRDRLTCTYRDAADAAGPVHPGPEFHAHEIGSSPVDEAPPRAHGHHGSRFEVLDSSLGSVSRIWAPSEDPARVSSNTGLTEHNAQRVGPQPPVGNARPHDETIQKLDERIRRLEDNDRAMRRVIPSEMPRSTLPASARAGPRLRFTKAKVKLFTQSHWVHTAEKVFKSDSFDSEIEPTPGLNRDEWANDLRGLREMVKAHQRAGADAPLVSAQLHDTVPSKGVCDVLIGNYLRTFGRLYHVSNMSAELRERMPQFWSGPKSSSKTFVVKLSLILAIGVPFTCYRQHDLDRDALKRSAQQWVYAAQSWLSGPAGNSAHNLYGLETLCLLTIARHVNGLGLGSSIFSTAALLSMSKQMGLNRNREEFSELSDNQLESMSRIWSTVVELSLASSLETGIPFVGLADTEASPPGNIDDYELIDGDSSTEPPTHADDNITDMSTHLLLLKSQALRTKALDIINEDAGLDTSYEEVVKLADQLKKACSEASAFFSSRDGAQELGPESVFHKLYIDMYLRKHILLLHRPFMLAAQDDPRFHLSRKICLESCMIMASYIDEDSPSIGIVDYSRMMSHGSGFLRGGLSLNVIVTLAYELNTQIQEEGPIQGLIAHDPARQLSLAGREPIFRRLEHIQRQLGKNIADGNPSLKRFVMVSALLGQAKALEADGNVKKAVYDAVKDAMQICTNSLEIYLTQHSSSMSNLPNGTGSWSDGLDVDLGSVDFDSFMDPIFPFN
ncbi:unnamed protein product [Discula destructiva]